MSRPPTSDIESAAQLLAQLSAGVRGTLHGLPAALDGALREMDIANEMLAATRLVLHAAVDAQFAKEMARLGEARSVVGAASKHMAQSAAHLAVELDRHRRMLEGAARASEGPHSAATLRAVLSGLPSLIQQVVMSSAHLPVTHVYMPSSAADNAAAAVGALRLVHGAPTTAAQAELRAPLLVTTEGDVYVGETLTWYVCFKRVPHKGHDLGAGDAGDVPANGAVRPPAIALDAIYAFMYGPDESSVPVLVHCAAAPLSELAASDNGFVQDAVSIAYTPTSRGAYALNVFVGGAIVPDCPSRFFVAAGSAPQ
jgi:hypothetical protein